MIKHLAKYLLSLSMLILGMLAVASCSLIYDDEFTDVQDIHDSDYCYVTLTINTSAPSATRVPTLDGLYDDGTDVAYENYINLKGGDFRFYLFNAADNKFITEVDTNDGLFIIPENPSNNSSQTYRVVGKINPTLFDGVTAYKAVFVANWGSYPTLTTGISTIADVQGTYNYSASWTLNANNLIPMFGVTNTLPRSTYDIKPGERTDIGTINLLRAMAKIEVCVSEDEDSDLSFVKLNRYSTNGLCAPLNVMEENEYWHNDWNTDFLPYTSIPTTGYTRNITTPLSFFPSYKVTYPGGVQRQVFTIYVPEYQNINTTTNEPLAETELSYISLKFNDDDSRVFKLYFKDYSSTPEKHFDVQRNNYYRYFVTRQDAEVTVIVDVQPYAHVTLEPEFGQ